MLVLFHRCVINCEMKKAVSSELSVESMCESCSEVQKSQATYTWTLKSQAPGSQVFTPVPNYSEMFKDTGKITLAAKRKSNEGEGHFEGFQSVVKRNAIHYRGLYHVFLCLMYKWGF